MYTREQQALDNYITGNWGEDDADGEAVDELRDMAGRIKAIIRYLQESDGPDNGCAEIVGHLRVAHDKLTLAHDLML